jgi:hypothetical protein
MKKQKEVQKHPALKAAGPSRQGTTLTREELYDQVWTTPGNRLAKNMGTSCPALKELCEKLQVPRPDGSYWTRAKMGQIMERDPLPPIADERANEIASIKEGPRVPDSRPDAEAASEAARQRESRIAFSKMLKNSHPLIKSTKLIFEQEWAYDIFGLSKPTGDRCLSICVSRPLVHRALRIMNAVLKGVRKLGHEIEIASDLRYQQTRVVIGEIKVNISIREHTTRSERPLTPEEQKGPRDLIRDRWFSDPTGVLFFAVGEENKKWRDRAKTPLEDRQINIVTEILRQAERARIAAREWEEQKPQREEDEHQAVIRRAEEKAVYDRNYRISEAARLQVKNFESAAESWARSEALRKFLAACESEIVETRGPIAPHSPEAKWLAWAARHIDKIDPLKVCFTAHEIAAREALEAEAAKAPLLSMGAAPRRDSL